MDEKNNAPLFMYGGYGVPDTPKARFERILTNRMQHWDRQTEREGIANPAKKAIEEANLIYEASHKTPYGQNEAAEYWERAFDKEKMYADTLCDTRKRLSSTIAQLKWTVAVSWVVNLILIAILIVKAL